MKGWWRQSDEKRVQPETAQLCDVCANVKRIIVVVVNVVNGAAQLEEGDELRVLGALGCGGRLLALIRIFVVLNDAALGAPQR